MKIILVIEIYRMNEIHNMFCDLQVDKFADISNTELQTFKLNDRGCFI